MKGFRVIIISLEVWQKGKRRISSTVFWKRLKFRVFLGVAALEVPCPVWILVLPCRIKYSLELIRQFWDKQMNTDGQAEVKPRIFPRGCKKA